MAGPQAVAAPINLEGLTAGTWHADTKKDFWGVCYDYATTQMKNTAKAFSYGSFWISFFSQQGSEVGKVSGEFSKFAGNTKDFLGAMEVPVKANEVRKACVKLYEERNVAYDDRNVLGAARDLFLDKIPSATNSICDGFKLTNEFIPFTSEGLRLVKGVNFGATFIGAANSGVKQVQQIASFTEATPAKEEKTTLCLINLARDTSFIALGILGSATVWLATTAIAPWMLLACLTSGLVFSIGGFFYERLVVNPHGRHDDLEKVQTNLRTVLVQRNEAIVQRDARPAQA